MCPYNCTVTFNQRLNYNIWSCSSLGGLRASSLETPGLHDTNLNKLRTQTLRGQELHGHINKEWGGKVFFPQPLPFAMFTVTILQASQYPLGIQ